MLFVVMLKRRRSRKVVNFDIMECKESTDKQSQDNYESITERIKQVKKKYKSILFASTKPESLPITVPVNVAIGLTKSKKRCLLIDLDLKRDAIAEAFELNDGKNNLRPKAVKTEFENLWVWPARNFAKLKHMNIKLMVEKTLEKFDFILINAPSLICSPDRQQITSAAQAAFICTKDASEATCLMDLVKLSNCTIIGHIRIPSQG